jgi:hypothetical protein
MAKEILVTELLSEQMISAGERLIDILDNFSCQVKAAFWMFSPEEKTWKLLLASPLVKQEGPRKYYKRIVDANKALESGGGIISLNDITVSDIDRQLIQLLQSTVPTDDSISNIRFSKNTINGVFIDDVHIYRMNVNTP